MAGSAINLSSNLANIIGGPVQLSKSQGMLAAPNAGLARILSRPSEVDINDPQSLRAAAQKALDSGDQATAMQYLNQALRLEEAGRSKASAARAERADARAQRGETRAIKADARARTAAARKMTEQAGEELMSQRDREQLLPIAKQMGIVTDGMTPAQIASEINSRRAAEAKAGQAGAEAAADAAAEDAALQGQLGFFDDLLTQATTEEQRKKLTNLRKAVENGKKFGEAASLAVKALDTEGAAFPDKGEIKLFRKEFKKTSDQWDNLDDDDWFAVTARAKQLKANNPEMSIEEISDALLKEYEVAEDKDNWLMSTWNYMFGSESEEAPAPQVDETLEDRLSRYQ